MYCRWIAKVNKMYPFHNRREKEVRTGFQKSIRAFGNGCVIVFLISLILRYTIFYFTIAEIETRLTATDVRRPSCTSKSAHREWETWGEIPETKSSNILDQKAWALMTQGQKWFQRVGFRIWNIFRNASPIHFNSVSFSCCTNML